MPIVICKICNQSFYVKPSQQKLGWGKYCSANCRTKAQIHGKKVTCVTCSKEIYRSQAQIRHSKSGNFFCSRSCQIRWKNTNSVAEKHPNWTGGVYVYRELLIKSNRKQKCILCRIQDMRILSAHHIDHNRQNNDLSNLVWLCLNCHHLVHHDKHIEEDLRRNI